MDGGGNSGQQDSPLSITSNIVGLLTFLVAIAAAAYARVAYLRNSDDEYFRVKASLSWYKTESRWLSDLLTALYVEHHQVLRRQQEKHGTHSQVGPGDVPPRSTEFEMYSFVMDDLLNLEQRLLDLVTEVEDKVSRGSQGGFTLVRGGRRAGRPSVGMAWLPVRTKALELVRQREALTARVQFLQMSMMSSRLRDLEARTKWAEAKFEEGLMNGDAQHRGWMNGTHVPVRGSR
ncbi:hypothetical protein VFPBJ_07121 [Purpureocillium lilacinum]|uniref:Uncharacterized protein n=1 Tax=Purpureocillium lilacinum TaxID=33203 RepID=A0A179GNQ0_PURLI|nr:hypothetical protein Purlil1_4798 [Purpureocillium lilacinum]OAQ79000.1 hypothetical protein VFPBJ_07121 [Purpureocillium lilacinum]